MVRLCRLCKAELPASRYFKCTKCQKYLPQLADEYVYHTGYTLEEAEAELYNPDIDLLKGPPDEIHSS